ncbi:VacJ family lipoprotein [Xinfangfangia sp. D13-10-4-6]|uniref:MlaA family lipoprotein n=1 Tax=Pseudogemmobacter hezensis TaxID=2737662 RepID=UPI0015540C9F|nr:VacJ family lipoprotein [Pseudogemmobacter hezensis]NPD16583.1 VacJ family lipoprotein [Pseudogemmobacter hezensis]
MPAIELQNPSLIRPLALLMGLTALVACGQTTGVGQVNDPMEPMNRGVHAVNKGLDTALVRPASKAYGTVVPNPLRQGVSNVADTLGLPGVVVNQVLQARVGEATTNTLRFAVNATAGIGGLFDVASVLGMPKTDADFGQTLAVWGVGEGPYVELPIEGPSNVRDTVGFAVDLAMDPVGNVFKGDDATATLAIEGLSRLNDRYRYSDTVDSILYDSADSYAQLRLLYQQNRRHDIAKAKGGDGNGADGDFIDPYEDDFIDPYAD